MIASTPAAQDGAWGEAALRRRIAELEAALTERDLRLREVDHRVGNQFQIVASLLRLAASRERRGARAAIDRAQAQVIAMSEVHACLGGHGAAASGVELVGCLARICGHLAAALGDDGRIALAVTGDRTVLVDAARIRPLGLVVAELVTNAVKHAFPDARRGLIRVEVARAGSGFRLVVADDGCGNRDVADRRPGGGQGSGLVAALAHQAGGRLARSSTRHGTTVAIEVSS